MPSKQPPPPAIHLPPFPPLSPDPIGSLLSGRDTFATWAGFYKNPTGVVQVTIYPPEEIERDVKAASKVPPQAEQVAAYRYLKQSESDITAAVVRAVFEEYPNLRKRLGADQKGYPEKEYPMPPVSTPAELKPLFGPAEFFVLSYAKDGSAYIGMSMKCTWDPEHRLGVMTYKSRVVAIGEGDMSFDDHTASTDGASPIRMSPQ